MIIDLERQKLEANEESNPYCQVIVMILNDELPSAKVKMRIKCGGNFCFGIQ